MNNLVNVSQDLVNDLVKEDAISRQAAIDAIENEQKKIMRSDWAIDQAKFSAMSEIREIILELPSVTCPKESCEDAISRQNVDDLFQQAIESKSANLAEYWKKIIWVREHVKDLPPVTCSEKQNGSGKWLHQQLIPNDVTGHIYGECSCCHKVRIVDNYCPNCGSRNNGGAEE